MVFHVLNDDSIEYFYGPRRIKNNRRASPLFLLFTPLKGDERLLVIIHSLMHSCTPPRKQNCL